MITQRLALNEATLGLETGASIAAKTGVSEIDAILKRDADAVLALAQEVQKPIWRHAIYAIAAADEVLVTGFQTIRGIAEDFTRRLSIARGSVRFLSPHDDGLVEWLPSFRRGEECRCLVIIDMAPYAREALPIVQTAQRVGMQVIVFTDELNTSASAETPFVFHVATKVDVFLESTGPMTTLMNVIIHEVAGRAPEKARKRIKDWPPIMRGLELY